MSETNRPKAYQAENRKSACAESMKWRKEHLGPRPHEPDSDQVERDANAQAQDLHRAILCLDHLREHIYGGKTFLLGLLAVELRALLYARRVPRPNDHFNPLLFRLAALGDLPLPIYGHRDDLSITSNNRGSFGYVTFRASLEFGISVTLMDLQEYLSRPFAVVTLGGGKPEKVSLNQVIIKTASTMGSGHYDEEIELITAMLLRANTHQQSALIDYLLKLAPLVSELGRFVIDELATLRVISEHPADTFPLWPQPQTP